MLSISLNQPDSTIIARAPRNLALVDSVNNETAWLNMATFPEVFAFC